MHTAEQSALSRAQFVWGSGEVNRRNQFVIFERGFSLEVLPDAAVLELFADTRYRLTLNGAFVATGPGRFVTSHPEYDRHDLAPYLRLGENRIRVEVNFYGASSYQSMPDGAPGFIAAGNAAGIDFSTPGDWKAYRSPAWRADAPKFSFAQGPVEICDTRVNECDYPVSLLRCRGAKAPWGPLKPCTAPAPSFAPQRPRVLEVAGALSSTERRIGFMSHDPDREKDGLSDAPSTKWRGFATWIWSPKNQEIVVGAFWSDLLLNGCLVTLDQRSMLGNHARIYLDLEAGWNLLTGYLEVLSEFWPYCLSVPHSAKVTLHARRDQACPDPIALSAVGPRADITLPDVDDETPPATWCAHHGNPLDITPARLMSWDVPAADALHRIDPVRLVETSEIEAYAATWCFSFAGEFLGHIVAVIEAPAGSILDLACDDWQREDGSLALYRSNPFTDAADRYVLRGGKQIIEGFHTRGGKLIQATLRVPQGSPPASLVLHDLWVRSRQTLGPDSTSFTSDRPEWTWAWTTSLRTLRVSTDEAYSDCPWRERASYIGDCLVAMNLHALYSPDLRVAARVLRQFGQAQLPNGQLTCCAPSWLRKPHEDYTLLWLVELHSYLQLTGDLDLIREQWPSVEAIWNSKTWEHHASGLWNANHHRLFIDWGVRLEERTGSANAVLNIFRIAAARACAAMARALNLPSTSYREEADSTQRALMRHLWHPGEGRLLASEHAGTPALHANMAALAFDIGNVDQRQAILRYVEPMLKDNLVRGIRLGQHSGHLELYFLYFALPGLANNGRPDLAEKLLTRHYGFLMKSGDDTLPECFSRTDKAGGSRCHTWSGAAATYIARYVLGIRPAEDANPCNVLFDPKVHDIQHAAGRIAHRDGWIDVAWQKINGEIVAEINTPPSVTLRHSHQLTAAHLVGMR